MEASKKRETNTNDELLRLVHPVGLAGETLALPGEWVVWRCS